MITFNHNILAAFDLETTGYTPMYHEIVQVAILPLTTDLDPLDVTPFNMYIRPDHEERAQKEAMAANGLSLMELRKHPDKSQVADCLEEWFVNLNLPMDKRLIGLTQNGKFDVPFMKAWLGEECYHRYFTFVGRDSMELVYGLNDRAAWRAEPLPFNGGGLKSLCQKFGIDITGHHDALADCVATAKVYKELMRMTL